MATLGTCSYMIIHEHTWAALGCRLNSACKSFNPEYWHQALASPHSLSRKVDHVGVTTMKRLDQGHFHPKLDPETDMSQPEIESGPPKKLGGEHSIKETFEQLVKSYSEHLHMSQWQSETISFEGHILIELSYEMGVAKTASWDLVNTEKIFGLENRSKRLIPHCSTW